LSLSHEAFEKLSLDSLASWIFATMDLRHFYFDFNGRRELSHRN
jgi:hypothetical protein